MFTSAITTSAVTVPVPNEMYIAVPYCVMSQRYGTITPTLRPTHMPRSAPEFRFPSHVPGVLSL